MGEEGKRKRNGKERKMERKLREGRRKWKEIYNERKRGEKGNESEARDGERIKKKAKFRKRKKVKECPKERNGRGRK